MRKLFWRLLKTALGVMIAGIMILGLLLLEMGREHRTTLNLPAPTGHFAVGRSSFVWTDEAAMDSLNPSPIPQKRQLLVWAWYPADTSAAGHSTTVEYIPVEWREAIAKTEGSFMNLFFKHEPSLVQTHSFPDPPVSAEQSRYPVVLLRPGGSALTTEFTSLAEDLASHGYFVVGFDAPYRSYVVVLPNGQTITRLPQYNVENANGNLADSLIGKLLAMWVSDSKFVLDQLQKLNEDPSGKFKGRMDFDRVGIVGHSFGGATALQFCHEDSRCKAAIDLDGIPFGSVLNEGLSKPAMFVLSDHSREMNDPSSHQVLAEIQSIYDRLPDGGRMYLVIRTANHFSFSDQALLNSPIALMILSYVAKFGPLDSRRGLGISADYVHTFFDVHLKGMPGNDLMELSQKYPEIQLQNFQAK